MSSPTRRVADAFGHRAPDRTPLFEIFSPFHPIYWDICGHTVATDAAMAWDAMAEGISWEELLEANIDAQYAVNRFFQVDMVRFNGAPGRHVPRPVKTGPITWTLNGVPYHYDTKTDLVVLQNPADDLSYSHRYAEDDVRRQLEEWDGSRRDLGDGEDPFLDGIRARVAADGVEWVYMAEIGAGTGVAFYPPFLLMWMIEAPELCRRWIDMHKLPALEMTRRAVAGGASVVAMGGDVSCDKGPFISPQLYREFILPVIQEHVQVIHEAGARAVYTSDGNHWPIKDELFFESGIDGYKEVDKAAGMTWPRLTEAGVAERVCIIGNLDARYTLCQGTPEDVRREVVECLDYGRQTPGGHIIHLSHSVHEDVPVENYYAVVDAYRDYFGLTRLPRP